jgi:hypothetical protein
MSKDQNFTTIYLSEKQWLNMYGSIKSDEFAYVMLLPVCLIGLVLNILTLLIFKRNEFKNMIVYKYLRIYTLNSIAICILLSTRFIGNSRQFFEFTNSYWAVKYFGNIYLPLINTLSFFQSCLDIILSFDRVVLFSNKFVFYKKLKPTLVSLIVLFFCFVLMGYYWFSLTPKQVDLALNETEIFKMHYLTNSKLSNKYALYVSNVISDVVTFVVEFIMSAVTIVLLRDYLNKKKVVANVTNVNNHELEQNVRAKKMEVRITVLVTIMSIISMG